MTIKQAFEKLAATCSAGMKNPFFIMRNLHDAFADIAGKIEGGGAAENITYDNTDSGLIADDVQGAIDELADDVSNIPAPISYSETEQDTGLTWIDGKKIYQITVSIGELPNNTSKTVAHGISNLGYVIDCNSVAANSTGTILPIPFVHRSTIGNQVQIEIDGTNITIATGSDKSAFTTCYMTLRYTKSA